MESKVEEWEVSRLNPCHYIMSGPKAKSEGRTHDRFQPSASSNTLSSSTQDSSSPVETGFQSHHTLSIPAVSLHLFSVVSRDVSN